VATAATTLALLLATPAALYVVRYAGGARELLRGVIMLPLMLPEILTAMALLLLLYRTGIGTQTIAGLLVGHTLIVIPYVFTNVAAAVIAQDDNLEEAAVSLGAPRRKVFLRFTLPLLKSGLIAGAMFAFVISFDLFNMLLLLKGIGVNTLPLELFDYLRYDFDPAAVAVSTLSIVLTFVAIALVDRFVGLRSVRFGR
jgi:putative spermidine/putrescine transport system permease protein